MNSFFQVKFNGIKHNQIFIKLFNFVFNMTICKSVLACFQNYNENVELLIFPFTYFGYTPVWKLSPKRSQFSVWPYHNIVQNKLYTPIVNSINLLLIQFCPTPLKYQRIYQTNSIFVTKSTTLITSVYFWCFN